MGYLLNMKKLILLVAVLIPVVALSQKIDHNKVYHYSVSINDPENANTLIGTIDPLSIEANNPNLNSGVQAGVEYRYKNRFEVSASYRRAYYQKAENTINHTTPSGVSVKGSAKENWLDANFKIYPFGPKIKPMNENVRIIPFSDDVMARIPAEKMLLSGFRAGFRRGRGVIRSGYLNYKGQLNDTSAVTFFDGGYSNTYNYATFNIGYSIDIISDLITVWEDFGEKKKMCSNEVYFDVLVLAYSKLDNMLITEPYGYNSMQIREYDINDRINSKLGARIGYKYTELRNIGLSGGVEIGLKPGPVSKNLYLNINLGVALSGIKPY